MLAECCLFISKHICFPEICFLLQQGRWEHMDKFCGNGTMLWEVGTDITTILQVIQKVNRVSDTVSKHKEVLWN